jgi:tetratricopeptide (TPR) repeat protein
MAAPLLTLVLLLVSCFSLATWVTPRFEQSSGRQGGGFMANMFGESRKLFANHFFTRSDVYFHSGYYPTIFDQPDGKKENHLAETAGAHETKHPAHGEPGHVHDEHEEEENFLGKPKDPMDAFSRHFFVSQHTHLNEKGTNAPKEILPWLKLAAQIDPNKVESYTVGAFWLRQLNKNDEAEQFLREGFRNNPQSYEIMLELGRCYVEKRDYVRARNILELAITRWREQENSKPAEQQNRFAAEQILNYLAVVEDSAGNRDRAISWLQIVRKLSPHPDEIDKRMAELRAGRHLKAE